MNHITNVAPRFLLFKNFKSSPWSSPTQFLLNVNRITSIKLNKDECPPNFVIYTDTKKHYVTTRNEYDTNEKFYNAFNEIKKNLHIIEIEDHPPNDFK